MICLEFLGQDLDNVEATGPGNCAERTAKAR